MVIFTIIGTLIGAGFASGKEIYLFFYRYGIYGIFGLAICCVLMSFTIYKTLNIIKVLEVNKYKELLKEIFRGKKNYLKFNNIIVNLFLIISFYIMVAGFGAYFEQEFFINKMIGSTLIAIICLIIFLGDIKDVIKLNSIIVPILILFIIIAGIKSFNFVNLKIGLLKMTKKGTETKAIFQGILYCGYNMILILPILVNLKNYIKNKKQILFISSLCGIIIFLLAMCIIVILSNIRNTNIEILEMPAIYSISENLKNWKMIYGIVILLAIFTTAISVGIGFLENISKNEKSYAQFAVILCITSVIISNFGFSNLVKIMFPIFGVLGFIQILTVYKHKLNPGEPLK